MTNKEHNVLENRKSDLISREQACQLALNSVDKCITSNDIMRMSSVDAVSREVIKDIKAELWYSGVNMVGEYQGVWVRFRDIEKAFDKHISGKENHETCN